MSRRFLLMGATICGLVMVAGLLLFPITTASFGDKTMSSRAIEGGTGAWLLLFAWLASAGSIVVFLKRADYIGIGDKNCRLLSLLGFELGAFFFFAHLIAGARGEETSWGFGFWLAFLASAVGGFAMYLTFNEQLAQKIADKAKDVSSNSGDEA